MSRKRIDLSKRQRRVHPFKIWKALFRLKTMDKLAGNGDDLFYDAFSIGAVIFGNWDDYSKRDQEYVVTCQLSLALSFLRVHAYVKTKSDNTDFRILDNLITNWKRKVTISYQALPFALSREHIGSCLSEQLEYYIMDDSWGKWIGRRKTG